MNIFIARDGAEIGEYPRDELEQLARDGQLQPTDYYWREGMETWLFLGDLLGLETWNRSDPELSPVAESPVIPEPIDPSKPPETSESSIVREPVARQRLVPIAAICVGFIIAAAVILHFIRSANSERATAPLLLPPAKSLERAMVDPDTIRDQAASDLRQRIERLPGNPAPPLHAFYYDVSVKMQRTYSEGVPWTAIIRGGENVIDPETEKTTMHTAFILTIDYRDEEWSFQSYRASVSDMVKEITTEIEEDENTPAPPSIVGMLGLKMKPK